MVERDWCSWSHCMYNLDTGHRPAPSARKNKNADSAGLLLALLKNADSAGLWPVLSLTIKVLSLQALSRLLQTYRSAGVLCLAVLMLFLASCQTRQSVQTQVLGQTATLIHKGKATANCATADRVSQPTAQEQAQALPEPFTFSTPQKFVPHSAEKTSFFSRLPLRHTAPPFYVLYKSWKMYLA